MKFEVGSYGSFAFFFILEQAYCVLSNTILLKIGGPDR